MGKLLSTQSVTITVVVEARIPSSFSLWECQTVRQITVINCIKGDVIFQMTGKMSITADVEDHQLEVIVEDENGKYKKHFIGLSDNVTYVVEDITDGDVSNYH